MSEEALTISGKPRDEEAPMASSEASSESNRFAELAELAGGFIHEIKNHLGTLKLNLELDCRLARISQKHHLDHASRRVADAQRAS